MLFSAFHDLHKEARQVELPAADELLFSRGSLQPPGVQDVYHTKRQLDVCVLLCRMSGSCNCTHCIGGSLLCVHHSVRYNYHSICYKRNEVPADQCSVCNRMETVQVLLHGLPTRSGTVR